MSLKEKSYKVLMMIPHLALLWDMRRHQRYEPRDGLDIEINSGDTKIYALLLDICDGGMRIISTDERIEGSKTISLSVDDFRLELPCEKIRRIQYYYGIKFGPMDQAEMTNLDYFIEHFTKEPLKSGLTESLK